MRRRRRGSEASWIPFFKKLGEDHAWIARLVARLLADPAGEQAGWVGLGFERYFLLLQGGHQKAAQSKG
jgi:hypothetical protein